MNTMEQFAANATHAVYVMSSPDGSDCEFLPFAPMASASELADMRTRWAGRNLSGVGVAGFIKGVPRVALKHEPSDFMAIVRLTGAFVQYVGADGLECVQKDAEIAALRALYALPDTRSEA